MSFFANFLPRFHQNNILKNIGANFIFKGISMVLSFVYVPIALNYMGDYRYGVWATISSIVMWIQLSDIGIGNGLRNKLTEALAHDDRRRAQGLVSTAYTTMFMVCLVLWLVYLIIAGCMDIAELCNLSIAEDDTNLALTITMAFVLLNFWLGMVSQIFYALQKPAVLTFSGTIGQVLSVIFMLVASYFLPVSLPLVAILLGVSVLLTNLGLSMYVFIKFPYLSPAPWKSEKRYIKSIASVGILLFIGQLNSTIVSSTDNILIAKLFDPAEVTPYTTAYKFFQILIMINGLVIMPMWSAFTLKKEQHEYGWIRKSLKNMNMVSGVLSIVVMGLIFLIPPMSDLWLQHHLEYNFLMLLAMAVYTIAYNFSCNYASLLCGIGRVHVYSLVSVISAILNIPLSLFFVTVIGMGVSGIMVGTIVSMLPFFIMVPIEAMKWLKIVGN